MTNEGRRNQASAGPQLGEQEGARAKLFTFIHLLARSLAMHQLKQPTTAAAAEWWWWWSKHFRPVAAKQAPTAVKWWGKQPSARRRERGPPIPLALSAPRPSGFVYSRGIEWLDADGQGRRGWMRRNTTTDQRHRAQSAQCMVGWRRK